MLGENWFIFALEPNLILDAETFVFHSGPKFLCFLVDFNKYFWFWCQTEIVSEKVYAVIWPVLEITSLKFPLEICTNAWVSVVSFLQYLVFPFGLSDSKRVVSILILKYELFWIKNEKNLKFRKVNC